MRMWDYFGRVLVMFGILLVVMGLVFWAGGRILGLGRLPGDIVVQKENFSFYFPVVTCLLLSAVLTLILHFFNIFRR